MPANTQADAVADGSAAGASLRASGWGWRHAGRAAWALRGLDLAIEPGERVLLLGASGAGKSTLLQAFAAVLGGADEGEEEGELTVDGMPPASIRGRAGLVLQDPDSQIVLARVGDDVAFGCENLGVPRHEIWPRVDAALEAVGLGSAGSDAAPGRGSGLDRAHPTSELSGGQKQRVALAGVVAMRPGILLLDEPTANLDPGGVEEVRDAVAGVLRESGATFVVVEHRVDVWLEVVDRVIVLAPGGGVLADGAPDAVLGARGAELAADGVWVPGQDPLGGAPVRTRERTLPSHEPASVPASAPELLLSTHDLAVARMPGRPVASGIDLEIRSDTATALTGPNGAGKTTLALTLAGLLPPEGGEVSASDALRAESGHPDAPTPDAPRSAWRPGRRRPRAPGPDPLSWSSRQLLTRIGVVFQDPEHQFVTGTVRGELEVSLKALGLGHDEIAERVHEVSDRLRLGSLLAANPYTLSGGEKRRLSVASALVARPRILILDEPTFGQDSRTWAELVRLLAEQMRRGTAVVAVTHDRAFIEALADHELVIGGRSTPTSATPTSATPTSATPASATTASATPTSAPAAPE
ncbi:ATP-binding cassette domain-containing protein [Herbiconiux sp.]|uniref:ABC transporter ATP-binding protein n=1 Tax=Herbiconiux sp. TaxID=1871186 RepID=UPI0025BCF6AD|nr:ATP-binding cassette domain-containing protein [Herbiconiux sp.]